MSRKNGGIIGPANTPVGGLMTGVAGGVWRMNDVLDFVSNSQWPSAPQDIENSTRFEKTSSDNLSRTSFGTPTLATKFTVSFWFKRTEFGVANYLLGAYDGSSTNSVDWVFTTGDALSFYFGGNAGSGNLIQPNRVFRDASAWYHLVYSVDTTQGTDSNRVKIYINGVQETSFSSATYPPQNATCFLFNSSNNRIADNWNASAAHSFNGYMAEFVHIDGQALDPTSFGETDSTTNIWKPRKIGAQFGSGGAGTNGFYLDFKDSSNLGNDQSGNNNDFTVNGLTSIDQSIDTCVNNFCTFNPLVNVPYSTYKEGDTFVDVTSTGNSSHHTNYGNIAFNSGKWYWEAKALGGNKYTIGLSDANNQSHYQQVAGTNLMLGNQANSYVSGDAIGWYSTTLYKNGSTVASSLSEIVTNDIMMVAVDADNGKIYFGKNGTWRVANSTTFDAAQNDTTFTTGEFYVSGFSNEDCDWSVNWGSPSYSISSGNSDANGFGNFEYPVPSGYYALNTSNLNTYG